MAKEVAPVDPDLFTKSLEFAGVFRDGDLATEPLSIELRYSHLNAHPPIGIIRGTYADWPKLESFFEGHPSAVCELESVSTTKGREKIHSRQVLLRELSCRSYPDDESKVIQQILGRFELYDVTIDCDYGQRGTPHREITFLMRGPTLVWMSNTSRTFSSSRNTKSESFNARLRISHVKDLRITAQPHFLYASRREVDRLLPEHKDRYSGLGKPHLSVEAEAFALTFTDRHLDRTDTDFEARALEVAETLCLLVSFLSKSNVTWYGRTLWSNGKLIEHYRDTRESPDMRLQWHDIVLSSRDVRRFIRSAFTAYQKGVHDGPKLRLPILTYVAAQSAPTVDEQFVLLFICLENVVGLLDQKHPWEVLERKELKSIAKALRRQLRDMGKDPQTVSVVNGKIPELARPAFRRRLCKHLKRLKVDLDDIGGYSGLGDTIKIRDLLIHGAEEPCIAEMVQERRRLQTVVERVLLTLLGWRGSTNTPTFANRLTPNG